MGAKKKYYVVWVGHQPGVYTDWEEAKSQIQGYPGAKYKSFKQEDAALAAYDEPWEMFYSDTGKKKSTGGLALIHRFRDEIDDHSICVDAACSGNPGAMEYRAVDTWSHEEIFRSEIYPIGTNNIGEFLGIVHALAMYHEESPDLTIYTDSRIAMGWVKAKAMKSKLQRNERTARLWRVVDRAERWLKSNQYSNPIKKWDTKRWGEIPADFGRK